MMRHNQNIIPKQATAFFRKKRNKLAFSHEDTWREEHAHAFGVAKVLKLDLLEDIRSSVDEAITQGKTFAAFKKELQPTLAKKGWWGKQTLRDPKTGATKLVQLGSKHRLKLIYDTNKRQAYHVGKWERIEATKTTHPYLLYQIGPSRVHREKHVGFSGLMLPVDDPFWNTHYPMNGYGCRCFVRQVSKTEYKQLESKKGVETQAPTLKTKTYRHKRTGKLIKHFEGVDPGFDMNMGKSRLFDRLPVKIMPGQKTYANYGLRSVKEMKTRSPLPELIAPAKTQKEAIQKAEYILLNKQKQAIISTPVGDVVLTERKLIHMLEKRSEARERYLHFLKPTLTNPNEIWQTQYDDGKARLRYIKIFTGKQNILIIAEEMRDGAVFYNAIKMNDKRINKQREGRLVFRKE